jgi:hypothetical protein
VCRPLRWGRELHSLHTACTSKPFPGIWSCPASCAPLKVFFGTTPLHSDGREAGAMCMVMIRSRGCTAMRSGSTWRRHLGAQCTAAGAPIGSICRLLIADGHQLRTAMLVYCLCIVHTADRPHQVTLHRLTVLSCLVEHTVTTVVSQVQAALAVLVAGREGSHPPLVQCICTQGCIAARRQSLGTRNASRTLHCVLRDLPSCRIAGESTCTEPA